MDLRSPSAFVRSLGLKPTVLQGHILDKFEIINDFQSLCDIRQEIARAFILGILWQTLTNRGSKATILSSDPDLGQQMMSFLKAVIRSGPPDLTEICNVSDHKKIQIGADPGWNILLLVGFDPEMAAKRGKQTRSAIILKENCSDIPFNDTKNALIGAMTHKGRRILHLW